MAVMLVTRGHGLSVTSAINGAVFRLALINNFLKSGSAT